MSKYLDFQELVPSGRKTKIIRVLSKNKALFGDLLDEFAKDGFGVKLSHPRK